ncbi:MAG: hypothetical protein GY697_03725 [Desulfobacterales bacterium]|nr:hypothetical protein [Desulfobacterales bacterium]
MESYPGLVGIPKDSRRSFPDTAFAFRANAEIVCCFYTLVCRVAAIDKKFPGGHRAFLERHQGWHNEHIMAIYQQGDALRWVRNDLDKYDIRKLRDWVQLDEDNVDWSWDMFKFDTQAAWLKGRYKKGNIYVRYCRRPGKEVCQG